MSRTLISEDLRVGDLRPLADYVVVRVLEREKTPGGILLPANKATPCIVGEVISRGPGIPNNHDGKDFPFELSPGERILFMDYAGERMKVSWDRYRILHESGIWARVECGPGDPYDFLEVKPWADRLVVEPRDETMTRSGTLYLPNRDMPLHWHTGKVIASGFGVWHLESGRLLPCECRPGDRVVFRRYAGANMSWRGKNYRIVQEVDVLAILEGD